MGLLLVRAMHVRWRTTLTVAALALVTFLALPASVARRFDTLVQILPTAEAPLHPDSSFQERKLLMTVAWVMFGSNPITGVGVGNYSARYEEYVDLTSSSARQYADPSDLHFPHNLFLETAAETGVLGLALFGAVLVAAWRALHRAEHHRDEFASTVAAAMRIALAGFLVSSVFLHLAYPRYLYLLFALAATLRLSEDDRETVRASASAQGPREGRIRPPIAVLVSRFPLITETFILREVIELERQGQAVLLVPMIREHPAVVHEEAKPWMDRALYTPWISPAITAANLRAFARRPLTVLSLLGWIVSGTLFRPRVLVKSLLLFPKSVYLAERLRDEEVQHLHAHFATYPTTMARIISSLSGIPFSFTVHAHDIFVDRRLLREKLRDARFVRSISGFNKAFLESLFPRETAGRIEVVHVGVAAAAGGDQHVRDDSSRTLRLLCVAALKPYKGIPFLVDACALLLEQGLDFQCDVIGTGPQFGAIARAIENGRLGDRVRLRGALPQHEVALAVREADVFVLPSIIAADRQMEGIPVALMEAMAAGKPVIATSISGIPELVVHGQSGLLVDPANPPQLAQAIRTLAADAALRLRLGARGREHVTREFSLPATVTQLRAIFDRNIPRVHIEGFTNDDEASLRRVHRGRDAIVYELIGAHGEEWIVKRHRARAGESRPPNVRAADEFRLMQVLAEIANLGAPRPISHDGATVVMTRARGAPLVRLIRDARGNGGIDLLERSARAAGTWLAAFHANTSLIHGDFWPGNVFAHDEGVDVIDFEGARPGSPQYDVDYFLRHTELFYRYRARDQWPRVRRAFLEGYSA
jgi:colanic acid/amylovoran biosynthesis glycosyltransferase